MVTEAKVKTKKEVAVIDDERVDITTQIHTNLRECVMNLIPELYYIPTTIVIS